MHFIGSIIPALIVLGILIIVHEFGHFIACRLSRVKVEKFSIGFGPEIFHWQGKETRYAISLFPLGGFVKPAGESVGELGETGPKPGDYLAAPLLSRMFIVVSGVVMNYVLAYFLFAAIFMIGRPIPGTTVGGLIPGYPAEKSGLLTGDKILKVDDHEVGTWKDLTQLLEKAVNGKITLSVSRKDAVVPVVVTPKVEEVETIFGEKVKLSRIGVLPSQETVKIERLDLIHSLTSAWDTTVGLTAMTHKAIFYLILGKLSLKTVSGPIGIINLTGSAAQMGLVHLLQLTATLSISLAVINLLPIPALDGGHLLFLLIEGIRRKPVSLKFQEMTAQIGFILLLVLMAFILYNDLVNAHVFDKIRGVFLK